MQTPEHPSSPSRVPRCAPVGHLDRLVRASASALEDGEGLLGSVLGRDGDGRSRTALVATDRRLLLILERFVGVQVTAVPYGDITALERVDGDTISITLVTAAGRHVVTRISDEPCVRVALALASRRIAQVDGSGAASPATTAAGTPLPARVRILA